MAAESLHFITTFCKETPISDSVDQAVVVLTAVGFHAQATAIKPEYVNEFITDLIISSIVFYLCFILSAFIRV